MTTLNLESILRIVSICTASLILIIGLLMLSGTMMPAAIPDRFRVLMGSLMIFYSGYRLWTLWLKRSKPQNNDDADPI
jgi:hypothetical protein